MRFESLIFDIDGTLWDSRALVAEGYNLQLRDEGLEHLSTDAETLKGLFGKVMTEIADSLIFALFLYRARLTPTRVMLSRFCICLFVNILMQTPLICSTTMCLWARPPCCSAYPGC